MIMEKAASKNNDYQQTIIECPECGAPYINNHCSANCQTIDKDENEYLRN